MTPGLIETFSLVALFAGAVLLAMGGVRLWQGRANRSTVAPPQDIARLMQESEERLATLLAVAIEGQNEKLDGLRREIEVMKSDIDWLTGERMIEQAISMARDGISAEDISADLGMGHDAAHTIATIRRH